jgi:hypothetical protein
MAICTLLGGSRHGDMISSKYLTPLVTVYV